jgi:formate C-acetyltransferase
MGFGMPAFVNDQSSCPAGKTRRGARRRAELFDHGLRGSAGAGQVGYRANGKSKLNMLKVLELTLNDGRDPESGLQLKPGRGDITNCARLTI